MKETTETLQALIKMTQEKDGVMNKFQVHMFIIQMSLWKHY